MFAALALRINAKSIKSRTEARAHETKPISLQCFNKCSVSDFVVMKSLRSEDAVCAVCAHAVQVKQQKINCLAFVDSKGEPSQQKPNAVIFEYARE